MQDAKIKDNDGKTKHRYLSAKSGQDSKQLMNMLYNERKMCGQEISDYIMANFNISFTPRAIQRTVRKYGQIRTVGDAFRLAGSKGRIHWALKALKIKRPTLPPKIRFFILTRDQFKCKLCGAREILEVDHIIPLHAGGTDEPENLQTLCHNCNLGKHQNE
jgi:5-methylcytosine-specific restriction protein A